MKTYSIFSIAAFILFASCQQKETSHTEVSGIVYTKGTSDPIANALVSLEWRDPADLRGKRHYVDSTRTNLAGKFKVAGDLPSDQEHYVIAQAEKHFETEYIKDISPNISRGISQKQDLNLIPFGWVKMIVKKTLGNDRMLIYPIIGGSIYGFYTAKDTTFLSRTLGNQKISLDCSFYLNNSMTTTQYYVDINGHDTTEVTIEF